MKLTKEQRQILTDAIVEDFINSINDDSSFKRHFIDDILVNGRIGFRDYSDEELARTAYDLDLIDALEEAEVR